jgi:hypothetical protein
LQMSSTPKPLPLERALWLVLPLMALAAALLLLRLFNPATAGFFPRCPFRVLTGYLCPGCGTLRALHQLLIGNVVAALRLNPLMMLLLPYMGYSATSSLLEASGGRALPSVFIRPVFIWLLLGIIILFWILRNISYFAVLAGG